MKQIATGEPKKKPYISSLFGWGLDGGSKRIYRAAISVYTVYIIRLLVKKKLRIKSGSLFIKNREKIMKGKEKKWQKIR